MNSPSTGTKVRRYLMTLRPLSTFYFGGENNLGSGDNRNYAAQSRTWPQQTSVLGLVRYLLLQEQGLLAVAGAKVKPEAKAFIGPNSFDLGATPADLQTEQNFGWIDQISPVFMLKDSVPYIRKPLNAGFPLVTHTEKIWYGGHSNDLQKAYGLDGYDPKVGLTAEWMALPTCVTTGLYEPFQESTQVGIQKGGKEGTQEQAFYVQTSYTLKEGWKFAFYLTLKTEYQLPASTLVPFGAENKWFNLECTPDTNPEPWTKLTKAVKTDAERLVLVSDSYLPQSVIHQAKFAVIDTKDFRFQTTSIDHTENYADLSNKLASRRRSEKYTLLGAGSVLYLPDSSEAEKDLRQRIEQKRLRQIGFNHFITLK